MKNLNIIIIFLIVPLFLNAAETNQPWFNPGAEKDPLVTDNRIRQTPDSIARQFSNYTKPFFSIYTKNKMYDLNKWDLPLFFGPNSAGFYLLNDSYSDNHSQEGRGNNNVNTTTTYYYISGRKGENKKARNNKTENKQNVKKYNCQWH